MSGLWWQTVGYIRQVFELGVIGDEQFGVLVDAVEQAVEDWCPALEAGGLL